MTGFVDAMTIILQKKLLYCKQKIKIQFAVEGGLFTPKKGGIYGVKGKSVDFPGGMGWS